MKLTEFFRLRMPDGTDPVNIEDFNDNFEVIDKELKKRRVFPNKESLLRIATALLIELDEKWLANGKVYLKG